MPVVKGGVGGVVIRKGERRIRVGRDILMLIESYLQSKQSR